MSLTLVRFSYAGLSLSLQSDLEKLERGYSGFNRSGQMRIC